MQNNLKLKTGKDFEGSDYVSARDKGRLTGQIKRVYDCMKDGQPRTLQQIAQRTGDPQASISAQLRNLRKDKFGAFVVSKEYIGNGLFTYWLEL